MIARLAKFFLNYTLFSFCLAAAAFAFGLDLKNYDTAANWVLIGMSIAVLMPMIRNMARDIREGTYGVDILAATAIITSLIMGEVWVAAVIVLMLTGGEALEDFAHNRAKAELSALLNRAPKQAHLLRGKQIIEREVAKLVKGDKIAIRPGEIIPIDAAILEGTASVDEASLTGESLPETKTVGSEILSGTVNLDGVLVARVLRASEDSQYQQIIKLVNNASAQRSPFVRMADRYAVPFTIFAFGLAAGAWFISGDSLRFLQVLVVATPCPLILAAPIAIVSGMSRAAKNGIIIKNGGALEQLATVKTIAFDKTGTLTHGELVVDEVITVNADYPEETILGYAAALEAHSNHVVARAIVQKAKDNHAPSFRTKGVKEFSGLGLSAHANNKEILVGRKQLLEERNVTFTKLRSKNHQSQTAAYVAVDGVLIGAITFRDRIRDESQATIDILRKLGIKHSLMVTGDNKNTAEKVANKLGITRVIAHALPADKLRAIEEIPASERPVAFVGDGINDAPVLMSSDVGIALGAKGATAASESADIVIMQDSISSVARAAAISGRTIRIAKQSIFIGIALSVILMIIFATGKFTPIYGALVQEVVDVIVIINALRAHHGDKIEAIINR
jgi:heavy metal translocating P-type ATPase